MDWLQFFYTGITDSVIFYLPAVGFNLCIYAYFVLVLRRQLVPLDGGRTLWGNPIIGMGRGVDGLYMALLIGFLFGLRHGQFEAPIYLTVGAHAGTLVSSFLKRRTDRPQGKNFFPLDNIDFILGASLLYASRFPMDWSRLWFGLGTLGVGHILVNLLIRPRFERAYSAGSDG